MIKAKGTLDDGRPVYVFGLSARNFARLRQGLPIRVSLDEMGGTGEVYILFGETEADITRELAEFIGAGTQVHGGIPGGH